ncbi:MAG: orotidine 5'-phosphate decarboxylase [Blautia sp.]|nr:orotidine 5'-phosphate decarboxylase [Lachnospiraceae bacterium]MBP3902346.1 orotidine 5'-phosphate decarboxylase [Blautia sp.]
MKLQTAIDRVTCEEAERLIEEICGVTDIVEIGTSLIKEFGLVGSVAPLCEKFPDVCFLADIKTCDEAAYEFDRCYEAGAQIATCMGFSSDASLRACEASAAKWGREWMIDLMELPDERVRTLAGKYPTAIFGIHLSFDNQGEGLHELVLKQTDLIRGAEKEDGIRRRIAAAGGIKEKHVPELAACGIDIVIAGSAVTKGSNVHMAAEAMFGSCHKCGAGSEGGNR